MDWLLDPTVTHLNHGSYGACPRPVVEAWQAWQRELERSPTDFLWRRLPGLLDEVREELGGLVGARPDDLALMHNSTSGLNAAIRSLRLGPGDEVLTTAHEYGALVKTWASDRRDARGRRAGGDPRRDRTTDALCLSQPLLIGHGVRDTRRGSVCRSTCCRGARGGRLRARPGSSAARSRASRRGRLRRQLPQVALRTEGLGVSLGAPGRNRTPLLRGTFPTRVHAPVHAPS